MCHTTTPTVWSQTKEFPMLWVPDKWHSLRSTTRNNHTRNNFEKLISQIIPTGNLTQNLRIQRPLYMPPEVVDNQQKQHQVHCHLPPKSECYTPKFPTFQDHVSIKPFRTLNPIKAHLSGIKLECTCVCVLTSHIRRYGTIGAPGITKDSWILNRQALMSGPIFYLPRTRLICKYDKIGLCLWCFWDGYCLCWFNPWLIIILWNKWTQK